MESVRLSISAAMSLDDQARALDAFVAYTRSLQLLSVELHKQGEFYFQQNIVNDRGSASLNQLFLLGQNCLDRAKALSSTIPRAPHTGRSMSASNASHHAGLEQCNSPRRDPAAPPNMDPHVNTTYASDWFFLEAQEKNLQLRRQHSAKMLKNLPDAARKAQHLWVVRTCMENINIARSKQDRLVERVNGIKQQLSNSRSQSDEYPSAVENREDCVAIQHSFRWTGLYLDMRYFRVKFADDFQSLKIGAKSLTLKNSLVNIMINRAHPLCTLVQNFAKLFRSRHAADPACADIQSESRTEAATQAYEEAEKRRGEKAVEEISDFINDLSNGLAVIYLEVHPDIGTYARQALEDVIFPLVYPTLISAYYVRTFAKDMNFKEKAAKIAAIPLKDSSILPKSFHKNFERQSKTLQGATDYMRGLPSISTPSGKVDCLVGVCTYLCTGKLPTPEEASPRDRESTGSTGSARLSASIMGADDLLPMMAQVLAQAGISAYAEIEYLTAFVTDESVLMGEAGYVIATVQTALEIVTAFEPPKVATELRADECDEPNLTTMSVKGRKPGDGADAIAPEDVTIATLPAHETSEIAEGESTSSVTLLESHDPASPPEAGGTGSPRLSSSPTAIPTLDDVQRRLAGEQMSHSGFANVPEQFEDDLKIREVTEEDDAVEVIKRLSLQKPPDHKPVVSDGCSSDGGGEETTVDKDEDDLLSTLQKLQSVPDGKLDDSKPSPAGTEHIPSEDDLLARLQKLQEPGPGGAVGEVLYPKNDAPDADERGRSQSRYFVEDNVDDNILEELEGPCLGSDSD